MNNYCVEKDEFNGMYYVVDNLNAYISDGYTSKLFAQHAMRCACWGEHCPSQPTDISAWENWKKIEIAKEAAAALGSIKSPKKEASSRANGKKEKRIVACTNCKARQKTNHIRAMEKAGFELRHLECKNCGQKTLA